MDRIGRWVAQAVGLDPAAGAGELAGTAEHARADGAPDPAA